MLIFFVVWVSLSLWERNGAGASADGADGATDGDSGFASSASAHPTHPRYIDPPPSPLSLNRLANFSSLRSPFARTASPTTMSLLSTLAIGDDTPAVAPALQHRRYNAISSMPKNLYIAHNILKFVGEPLQLSSYSGDVPSWHAIRLPEFG